MSYTTIISNKTILSGKKILYAIVDQADVRNKNSLLFDKMYELTYQMTARLSATCVEGVVKYFDSIDKAMVSSEEFDLVIIQSVGNFINRNKFFIELDNYIKENTNFFLIAFTLDWHSEKGEGWIECHNQMMVVNVDQWRHLGRPIFGNWESGSKILPNYSRSLDNFHDNYTPFWIKGESGTSVYNNVCQGWNWIKTALESKIKIDNFTEEMRACRLFVYPEFESDNFYKAITTKDFSLPTNPNQRKWIKSMFNSAAAIWIFNSEYYRFSVDMKHIDCYLGPASGFKYLDYLNYNPKGSFVFYDINKASLIWLETLRQEWDGQDFYKYLQRFSEEEKKNFKFIHGKKLNKESIEKNLEILYRDFGGKLEFQRLWKLFQQADCKFVQTNLFNKSEVVDLLKLAEEGSIFFNFSNIFATDFTLLEHSISQVKSTYDSFLKLVHAKFTKYILYGSDIDGNWQTLNNIHIEFTPSVSNNFVETIGKKDMNRMTSDVIQANKINSFTFIDVGCSGGILKKLRNFEPVLKGLGVDPLVEECSRLHNLEENPNIKYIPAYVAATGSTHPTGYDFWRTYVGNLQKQATEFNEGSNGK